MTDEEIEIAINKIGKKGLAWDCLTAWSLVLITITTPEEIRQIAEVVNTTVEDINLDWMNNRNIKLLEQ